MALNQSLETSIQEDFLSIAKDTNEKLKEVKHIEQIKDSFSINCTTVSADKDYDLAYNLLGKIHGGKKNLRFFKQLGDGNGEQGRKCSVCGERNAYFFSNRDEHRPAFLDPSAVNIAFSSEFKSNEALCSVCSIKRLFESKPSFPSLAEICLSSVIPEKYLQEFNKGLLNPEFIFEENLNENYFKKNDTSVSVEIVRSKRDDILAKLNLKPSQLPKYYAVILFDGDHMGNFLSGEYLNKDQSLEDFHKALSKALGNNAKEATQIVNKVGRTVYAGGDDFLGFCQLSELLPTVDNLRKVFKEKVNDPLEKYVNEELTMSAGVVISHYKTPLSVTLNWAKKMEKEAKSSEGGDRDALGIAVLKHSGDIVSSFLKWGEDPKLSNVHLINKLVNSLTADLFSNNFIHTLELEFSKLNSTDNSSFEKQFQCELKRLLYRSYISSDLSNRDKKVKELNKNCLNLSYQFGDHLNGYFSIMKIADFIARQIGGEKDDNRN